MARDTKSPVESTTESALDAIYREHFEFVSSVLGRLGVDAADLDDASQDVFVVAHRRLGQFEGRAAVRTWLYSIAIRVASNRRRKHARRDALLVLLPRPAPEDLEDLAARGQARALLEALLDRLDEHKRVVFVLAELEELTVPAIADLVGENPRTVYSRLRVARARVASELDRLHAPRPIELGAAIVATRPRPTIAPERARRAWVALLAKLAGDASAAPIAAAGIGLWAKLAIGGTVAAAVAWTGMAVLGPTDPSPPATIAAARAVEATPRAGAAPVTIPDPPANAASEPPRASPPSRPPAPPRGDSQRLEAPATPIASPPSPLAEEIAALDRARAHLAAGDTGAAITELDRYAARFERGTLQREASGVRVGALCMAGREHQAVAYALAAGLPRPSCAAVAAVAH